MRKQRFNRYRHSVHRTLDRDRASIYWPDQLQEYAGMTFTEACVLISMGLETTQCLIYCNASLPNLWSGKSYAQTCLATILNYIVPHDSHADYDIYIYINTAMHTHNHIIAYITFI